MWTKITRPKYERDGLRYASDTKDEEWALIELLLPPAKALGRPRTTDLRDVVNALLYLLRCGCPWRLLPKDFPPRSTVQRYFYAWRADGVWQEANQKLLRQDRLAEGRNADPSAGVIDSQSAKTTESGGPRGFDAGKKVNGRKRHIMTDTGGRLLTAVVHSAAIQDRDGAPAVFDQIRSVFPDLKHVFADGAYRGPKLSQALKLLGRWTIEIIKRSDDTKGFEILPRRWVVERTFAWLNRNRRLAKDFEASIASAEAWLFMASLQILMRRLARP